ncbi:MAG TPA: DegT/DnrJ/EryC1/StrS family aminotransferase [Terriglobales bacterium]|jgi:perosamine synthetase|nr:DegT/DnrJ/EryC1/StrS family aminotransferase [Terriglobales bacterium]
MDRLIIQQTEKSGEQVRSATAAKMARSKTKIPVAAVDVSGNELKYASEAISSSWISSTGPYITRFEQEFADACGTRTAVAVVNGTIALHLALLTLGVREGDEVLVPSLTYVATANAVRYVGATPVFVDVDPNTWCIDPNLLEPAITNRTKGIIPVHLYGHPADMDAINHIAAIHGLWVLEDAAEAHFASYKSRTVGSLARMATFSFYGNKLITCGEGGAITLNDPALELRMRSLRGQGMDPQRRYYFPITGYNFRITNVAAAILCGQMERRESIVARRLHIFQRYRQLLAGIPGICFQPVADWANPAPWLFCITVNEIEYGRSRDELAALLMTEKIDTRPFFFPLHKLPPFHKESCQRGDYLPVTERLGASGINLPTYNELGDSDLERIAEVIRNGRRGGVTGP